MHFGLIIHALLICIAIASPVEHLLKKQEASLAERVSNNVKRFLPFSAVGKTWIFQCKTIDEWKRRKFPKEQIAINLKWDVTHNYVNQDGYPRSGFLINGQSPGPAIRATENDWIRIVVRNFLPVAMTIHFHGIDQIYTPWSDGVPGVTQYPILPGNSYVYIFQFKHQHGAFWYHAHYRAYAQDGVFGPISIRPAPEVRRPYDLIEGISQECVNYFTNEAEVKPINIIVSDGFKLQGDEATEWLTSYGIVPLCTQSILVNGKGRVKCESPEDIEDAIKKQLPPGIPKVPKIDPMGCTNMNNWQPIVDNEAPGFSKCPGNTTSDREIMYTNNQEYLYIHLFNMAAEMPKAFSIDEHDLIIIGVDGMFCEPKVVQQIELPLAVRYTVIVKTKKNTPPGTIYAMRFANSEFQAIEGISYLVYGKPGGDVSHIQALSDAPSKRTQDIGGNLISKDAKSATVEDLIPLGEDYAPFKGDAHHTVHLVMNMTQNGHFTVFASNAQFDEADELKVPYLLQTNPSELDFSKIPIAVDTGIKLGDTIDIIIDNPNFLWHPFHMHGHAFSIIGHSLTEEFKYENVKEAISNDPSSIDFDNAQFVDTVNVAPGGHAVVRFTANNPGYWLFHCHINHHFIVGMAGFIVIDPKAIPPIPLPLYLQPKLDPETAVQLRVTDPNSNPK